ncbi:unspecific monooxygenase [Teladorsagia circumcincta]|uniref:Unspecific monooxygenase n=1 Tax=Teladorsagia circumcincta TaxID=45464 RepID=A0A2G9UYZ8_TELCI|nr:unspecific monooxygenase [Teladorsagia circumcincta]
MYDLTDLNKPLAFVLRDWTKKYGAVYGIQEGLRRTLVVSDVGMIRDLFMKQYDYFYGRKNFIIGGDVENDPRVHVFEAQGVRWKRLRTISTPAFSAASLKKIRPTVESSALALMEFFEKEANQKAFNIFPFFKEFSLDVIYRIAMGQRGSEIFTDKEKVAAVDYVSKHLTREEITAQCFVFLLAGFDTTATSLAFVTYLLAKNPSVQTHLQEEIDQHCSRESINYETLASLKYLDAVIKESLRMYPLAAFAVSRRCMKSTTLGDVPLYEGDFVCADTLTLHFNREIWGDDADDFRPERWLEQSERPTAAFLSFGLGPRQCIGMRLALMEEKLVLAHLLQRYDIIATDDTEVRISWYLN